MIRFIIAILISAVALGAQAQSKIDNLIDRLEKKNDVETTYTERRTPSKKLYKVSKILTFKDVGYYNHLIKAFEDERENTVSAVKTSSQITYKFQNKKGTSTYTLTRTAPYTLIMTWRSGNAKDDDDAFNEVINGSSTTIIIGDEQLYCDSGDDDCLADAELWQSIGREISEISTEMGSLDLSKKSDCRRYVTLERKRAKLQKRLAGMGSYQVEVAQQQAAVARQQAEQARQQAAQARQQAAVAREAARKAREQARYAVGNTSSSSSTSSTTIYYNY